MEFNMEFCLISLVSGFVFGCVWLRHAHRKNLKKITLMLEAIENNDATFRFSKGRGKYNALFIATLNRINEIFSQERLHIREQEKFFELMIDNVITGIITIDEKGYIVHCNEKALALLGMDVLNHVSQLKKEKEDLYHLLMSVDKEGGGTIAQLAVKYTHVKMRGNMLKLVAINDIGEELEEKEVDSWTRLIRVMTHEIMNTITPVASLSDTLLWMADRPDEDGHFKQEIVQGLHVISSSSKGLLSFVDSYRSLTKIPVPNKQPVYVKDLIHRVLLLEKESLSRAGIHVECKWSDDSILIYVDENLIAQVMVNLVKNAIAAIEERKPDKPEIRFTLWVDVDTEDVVLDVANNGQVIDREIREQLFVPFFTTKSSGSGVGLFLSRQMVRLHGGTLKLKDSTEKETTFSIRFR